MLNDSNYWNNLFSLTLPFIPKYLLIPKYDYMNYKAKLST